MSFESITSLKGKTYVIMGIANKRSIGWGIARVLNQAGATLVFTARQERSKANLESLVHEEMSHQNRIVTCDVTDDESIINAFKEIENMVGTLHGLVHSIAFADKEELKGEYVETTRKGYHLAQDSSAYSLVAVSKAARPLMTEGGSIITLSYLGGERVVKNYNVMGVAKAALEASVKYLANDLGKDRIRVNSISAGPIRTLAAKGISGFNEILKTMEEQAPLRRTVTQEEVGTTAYFLLSPLSGGITGENIHVDSGYHILGF